MHLYVRSRFGQTRYASHTLLRAGMTAVTMFLGGCIAIATDDSVVRVKNGGVVRTTNEGTPQALRDGQWISTALPEAKLPRLPVWYIRLEDSGVRAKRYGYDSNSTFRYIDPLSPIVDVNAFSANGWITYLVKGNDVNDFQVRSAPLDQSGRVENLGHLQRIRGEWRVTPTGGQTVAGQGYHLTSKGIFLWRNPVSFSYIKGPQVTTHLLPDGWRGAWLQKGDLEASRVIAVVKHAPQSFDPARYQIGFFDLDSARILPDLLTMSFLAGSEGAEFNNRFYLYETANGALTITLEDGLKQVVVRNVRTGAKRVAFERSAGISRIKAEQTATGRISIEAAVGFKNEMIFDAEDFLYNNQRVAPAN